MQGRPSACSARQGPSADRHELRDNDARPASCAAQSWTHMQSSRLISQRRVANLAVAEPLAVPVARVAAITMPGWQPSCTWLLVLGQQSSRGMKRRVERGSGSFKQHGLAGLQIGRSSSPRKNGSWPNVDGIFIPYLHSISQACSKNDICVQRTDSRGR